MVTKKREKNSYFFKKEPRYFVTKGINMNPLWP